MKCATTLSTAAELQKRFALRPKRFALLRAKKWLPPPVRMRDEIELFDATIVLNWLRVFGVKPSRKKRVGA